MPGFNAEDCSRDALQLFKAKASKSGRVSEQALKDEDEDLLENLQLRDGRHFKRAATLLFLDNPERYVSGASGDAASRKLIANATNMTLIHRCMTAACPG